jgi:two-component system, sensor histidine kinase and response regulator
MSAREMAPLDDAAKPVVLVVDDSPEYLSLVGGMLEDAYTVRVASSGRRALQLAAQEPHPDLVLLDVLMPDMDGHAVLASLRADARTHDIPAIFFTSLEAPGDELAGLSQGAADYIVKPAPPAVLRARVRTQVELKQVRDYLRQRNRALQAEVDSRLRAEKALQETLAELDAFSYTVSHDLRSPLSAINAFALSLLESEAGSLSDQGRHRLGRILAGSERMGRMIDDILACSRAERTEMCCRAVELGLLAAEAVAEARALWPGAAVEIGPLPQVLGDACMLRQVFANLVGNALKFSGGRADARVAIDAKPAGGGAWEISVRDNGAGFDPAHAARLFGLFQRLHAESEFPGSGVGLAIVKRLVARHGGSIRAESVPGGWTTFTFTMRDAAAPIDALHE